MSVLISNRAGLQSGPEPLMKRRLEHISRPRGEENRLMQTQQQQQGHLHQQHSEHRGLSESAAKRSWVTFGLQLEPQTVGSWRQLRTPLVITDVETGAPKPSLPTVLSQARDSD